MGGIIWGGGGDFSQIFKRRGGMRGEGRGQKKPEIEELRKYNLEMEGGGCWLNEGGFFR